MDPWKIASAVIVAVGKAYDLGVQLRDAIIKRRIERERVEQQRYNDRWAREHHRGKYRDGN